MNFNNNRFDRRRDDNNRRYERPKMHEATCSKCGKSCEVPFRPTGNRPIFCNDCFRTEGGANSRSRNDRGSRSTSDRTMYDAICDNCGNRCQIPFPPRPGRPVYCSHCFEQVEKGDKGISETQHIQEQLDALNIKLGKILQILSADTVPMKANEPEEVTRETAEPVVVVQEITEEPETKKKKITLTKKKSTSKKKAPAATE